MYGGSGSDTYEYSAGDGNDTIHITDDGSTNIIKLDGIDSDDVLFSRSGDDLAINFSDISGSLLLDDYFDNDGNSLIIEASDNLQIQLTKNSNIMTQIISSSDTDDSDGGSIGATQTTTQVDTTQISHLWTSKHQD